MPKPRISARMRLELRAILYAYYEPAQFQLKTPAADVATYRWNSSAHNFCPLCGCGTFSDSPDFKPDGSWDKKTRRIGVNARLFDAFRCGRS